MATKTSYKDIAKRLESELTAAECSQLLLQVQGALTELNLEMEPLHPGDMVRNRGKERQRILLSGTPEDLLDLRDKFDVMQAQLDQLQAQRDELHRRREAAAKQEALNGLPALHDALREKITAAEDAQRALEAAFDAVDAAYMDIYQARNTCSAGGLRGAAGTTPQTIDRLVRLTPFSAKRRHFALSDHNAHLHIDNLGLESSTPAQKKAA